MSQPNTPCEFLSGAAQESLSIVEMHGSRACDDFSLCLPAPGVDPSSMRRLGRAVLFRALLGFSGLIGGVVIATIDQRANDSEGISAWLLLAAFCSIGGILSFLSNSFFQRRFVARQIGSRHEGLTSHYATDPPICVNIEDASTFSKFKIVPEDIGYLALDQARRMMLIEGIRYRYLIHGKDVRKVEQVAGGNSTATAVEYVVGDTSVDIAIQHDSAWHELKRQTIGAKHDVLINRIRETLGLD